MGQPFISEWRRRQSGHIIRENRAISNLSKDIERIFEFDDLQITPSEDETTFHVLVNREPYRISDVGAGLTQFVLVLANAAVRRPNFVLIDEPELNLHPALQLDFLTTLASYTKTGVLFSTHSIGLARSAAGSIAEPRRQARTAGAPV